MNIRCAHCGRQSDFDYCSNECFDLAEEARLLAEQDEILTLNQIWSES